MMFVRHTSVICPIIFCCCIILASCGGSAVPSATVTPRSSPTVIATPTPIPTATSTTAIIPQHYTSRTLFRGSARPDDLAFDQEGHLLFSDFYNGTISRVNSDGSITVV